MNANGNIAMQFLWDAYHTNLAQVTTAYATQLLGMMAVTLQALVSLYIILFGYQLMFGSLTIKPAMDSMIRLVLVEAVMTAGNYQTWVTTPVTTTIPNMINNILTNGAGLVGAQGYDGLLAQIDNFKAAADAQMVPSWYYFSDRIAVWGISQEAEIIVLLSFFIWSLASACADFLMPIGTCVIPFYLFRATRGWTERWWGKIASLFIVMILAMMVGQVVIYQDAQFVQKYLIAMTANTPNPNFVQGMPPMVDPGAGAPMPAGTAPTATNNNDSMIDLLTKTVQVFLYGLCLLFLVTGLGLYIGGAHGFSMAPVTLMAMSVSNRVASAITRQTNRRR